MNRIFGMMLVAIFAALAVLAPQTAFAAEGGDGGSSSMIALAAAIAIAGAAIGAASGQGKGMAAAMESIGRNPNSADRIQTPMIIALAFTEALALYGFVIGIMIVGKI